MLRNNEKKKRLRRGAATKNKLCLFGKGGRAFIKLGESLCGAAPAGGACSCWGPVPRGAGNTRCHISGVTQPLLMVEEPLALRSPCQRPYYDNQDTDTAYQHSRGGGVYTTPLIRDCTFSTHAHGEV